jgi:hypothetical protein
VLIAFWLRRNTYSRKRAHLCCEWNCVFFVWQRSCHSPGKQILYAKRFPLAAYICLLLDLGPLLKLQPYDFTVSVAAGRGGGSEARRRGSRRRAAHRVVVVNLAVRRRVRLPVRTGRRGRRGRRRRGRRGRS